jgi:acyl-CoA synthetase (AMP-forming)/AMP-acid ligase II
MWEESPSAPAATLTSPPRRGRSRGSVPILVTASIVVMGIPTPFRKEWAAFLPHLKVRVSCRQIHDMLHVRGVNVFPTTVGNVLARLSDQLSGEFQILVDHPSPHQFLRVELAQHLAPEQVGDVAQQVKQALREQLSFRAEPELVPYGTLPRTEQKAHRVIKTYQQAGR